MLHVRWVPIGTLKQNPHNARTHKKGQVKQIADSIRAFDWTIPILTDEKRMILAGTGRYLAATTLGLREVPIIIKEGLELAGNTEIFVGRQSYSADRLHELRREFGGTHVFQRMSMEDAIVDIPVAAGATPIGNLREIIDLQRTQGLWSALLSAALLRAFTGQRDLTSSWPVTVLGSASRGLVQHPRLPSWIQKRTALEFDTRSIYLSAGKRVLGIVCETKVRNIIDGSCAELMKLGVPVMRARRTRVGSRMMSRTEHVSVQRTGKPKLAMRATSGCDMAVTAAALRRRPGGRPVQIQTG